MVDLKKAAEEIDFYLRPSTYPLAIKMLKSADEIPEKARRPVKDLGIKVATCQTISMARRYGWTLAIGKEDHCCSLGMIALGFGEPNAFYTEGNLCEGMYTETAEAGRVTEAELDKFEVGRYKYFLVAPLDKATFKPDVILIFGNSAQVMRLVQAALYKKGGRIHSSFSGRADCADMTVTTMKTGECQVILPCTGDRFFAQTQDHEMAFTIPYNKLETVLEGLRATHKAGIRYPATPFLNYQGKFPPKYDRLLQMWEESQTMGNES
ncbi:MAG TPA: DUF169 domain-containing protein [Candidatus Limnocylindrales bacterium]|nr:DUF169 domain-containing protein [Candidatus Limnocylindrales bacterium]